MFRWVSTSGSKGRLPHPTGPHSIGFIDYEWKPVASEHVDKPLTSSHVLVRIYYPSTLVTRNDEGIADKGIESEEWRGRSSWIPSPAYYHGYGYYLNLPWYIASPIFRLTAGNTLIWAIEDAPMVTCSKNGQFPLVVFSHGLGGIRTTYSTICTDLASHGYIVASIEHRSLPFQWLGDRWKDLVLLFNKLIHNHPHNRDGTASMSLMPQDEPILPYQQPPKNVDDKVVHEFRTKQLMHRQQEVSSVIDLLTGVYEADNIWTRKSRKEKSNRKDPLSNPFIKIKENIDRENIIVAGHSFGGATSLYSVQMDQRIKAAIVLDPWMYPLPSDFEEVKMNRKGIPHIVISSETFEWPNNNELIKSMLIRNKELDGFPSIKLTLKKSSHMDQSDFSAIIPAWMFKRFRGSGLDDPLELLKMNGRLVRCFANGVVGRENDHPEIQDPLEMQIQRLLWDKEAKGAREEDDYKELSSRVKID